MIQVLLPFFGNPVGLVEAVVSLHNTIALGIGFLDHIIIRIVFMDEHNTHAPPYINRGDIEILVE